MAYINEVHTEAIQVGTAFTPPVAAAEFWPSIDPLGLPQGLFSAQNWGVSNFVGMHNQIGLTNQLGLKNLIGLLSRVGQQVAIGGQVDAQPAVSSNAFSMAFTTPLGDLFGSWKLNGLPIEVTSDIKNKKNITPLVNSLDKVLNLQGVEYDRSDYEKHEIGLVAQEVEKVVPDLVDENSNKVKVVHYQNLTALLVEAIKEQQAQINELKGTVQELSTKLAECCN